MGSRHSHWIVEGDVARLKRPKGVILIDAADLPAVQDYCVRFSKNQTSSFVTCQKDGRGTRLAKLLLSPGPGQVADHINGDPLDNRRANIRLTDWKGNNRNRAKTGRPTSSRFKGVSRCAGGRWAACIYDGASQVRLGRFAEEIDAARAYDAAARERFGRHAALNFPQFGEQSAHRPRTKTYIHPTPSSNEGQHSDA